MTTRIYVGNLPYSASSQQLTEMFGQYGDVTEATIVMDRDSGRSKGFAFVEMPDDAAARSAITALDGQTLDNRAMRVSEAQQRPHRESGSRERRW